MHPDTLALLRCVNHQEEASQACGGTLRPSNGSQLRCTRCQRRYPVLARIPHLLPEQVGDSDYMQDDIIQTYYEAHYAPFIQRTEAIASRLVMPHARRADAPPSQAYHAPDADPASPVAAMTRLAATEALTDVFYQTMVDLCRPLIKPGMRALDVGCGLGRMTGELARLGAAQVLGMDRSPRMVEEAAHILRAREPVPVALNVTGAERVSGLLALNWALDNVDFLVGDAQQIPLAAGAFDLVTCLNVLDRVPQPDRMIAQLGRVLAPGGHLVIADPYHWDEQFTPRSSWIVDMADLFQSDEWQRVEELDGIPFVIRYYNRRVTIYMNHCLIYRKKAE